MAIETRVMGLDTQYKTAPRTWAQIEADGAVNVYDESGYWLGWCNAEGALMSTAGLDGSLDGRIYSAAQTVRHLPQ